MHTLIVIVIGLLLLGACLLMGRTLGDEGGLGRAALSFLPVWLMGAGVNMYIGVKNAAMFDIETWMPGQPNEDGTFGKYRETHSADYVGGFQARLALAR